MLNVPVKRHTVVTKWIKKIRPIFMLPARDSLRHKDIQTEVKRQ